jgi:hypothetical protein
VNESVGRHPPRHAAELRRANPMSTSHPAPTGPVLANLDGLLPDLEALYKDIHAHPELSM